MDRKINIGISVILVISISISVYLYIQIMMQVQQNAAVADNITELTETIETCEAESLAIQSKIDSLQVDIDNKQLELDAAKQMHTSIQNRIAEQEKETVEETPPMNDIANAPAVSPPKENTPTPSQQFSREIVPGPGGQYGITEDDITKAPEPGTLGPDGNLGFH